jgi:hypothetical protein
MSSMLPPPDPFESLGMAPPADYRMEAPAAMYLDGPPTPETKRLCDVILDLRPGALIVVASRSAGHEPHD